MLFKTIILTAALLASPALAQDELPPKFQDRILPDEAQKVWALKRAYQLNGNSMVGNNRMIDLTDPDIQKADRLVTTVPVPTTPQAAPPKTEEIRTARHVEGEAVCRKHGMRTVYTHNGLGWRCKR